MSNKLLCLLVILDLVIQKMVKTVVAKFSYFLVRFIPPICTIDETSMPIILKLQLDTLIA